jgi:hypothetical protein
MGLKALLKGGCELPQVLRLESGEVRNPKGRRMEQEGDEVTEQEESLSSLEGEDPELAGFNDEKRPSGSVEEDRLK